MAVKAYYIPAGPANLAAIFPSIDFTQVAEYFLEVIDSNNGVIATTPMYQICGCEDDEDCFRIHFLNGLGAIDGIDFKTLEKTHETKSDGYQKPTAFPLLKTDHSIGRFNVKSNDTIRACTIQYYEDAMDWLDELFDSPLAWIEQPDVQGQGSQYLPIVILDRKNLKIKQEDRYVYQVEIEFKFSHEKFIIRN